MLENLHFFGGVYGIGPFALRRRIREVLEEFDLAGHEHDMSGNLPGGFKQRLSMAVGMLHRPEILFLDEPTSGLDPSTALEIHRILKELKDDGMAIFLTTHNMEEATKLCDHVALLNEGVIVEYGTPEEICLKYNRIKKYRVQLTDGSRHVLLHGADTTGRITSWMNEDRIETLHTCEPTLETVFLEVTGRELQ